MDADKEMMRVDAAIGVVKRDGRVLICQRKTDDTLGDFWEFPGGKCEPGESLQECLARELMEEVAIKARVVRKLTPIEHDYPDVCVRLHPFLCEHLEGEATAIECQRTKWVEASELSGYQFPPANESLLEEVVREMKRA
ncbi:MAG: 8-oxo-dGTP diphosphatase MutT [Tepidisphaeraceae bacterium]|jgi:mutator protein MutT